MASELFFLFFDVQHGHSTYIKFPNGKHWFIDLGQGSVQDSSETFSPLMHMKFSYDVQYLDKLVITHPHYDHIADIPYISLLPPKTLWAPNHLSEQDVRGGNLESQMFAVNKYLDMVKTYSHPIAIEDHPDVEANNGGVYVRHFLPTTCSRSNLNNHSIVTVLSFAGTKVLIPGDNEAPSWKELLTNPDFIKAIKGTDILLAAHHGREAGYCAEIFEHFNPCLTIVSDGPNNKTSAVSAYSALSTGWTVYSRSGTRAAEKRNVLTTRSDKGITVRLRVENDGSYSRIIEVP